MVANVQTDAKKEQNSRMRTQIPKKKKLFIVSANVYELEGLRQMALA